MKQASDVRQTSLKTILEWAKEETNATDRYNEGTSAYFFKPVIMGAKLWKFKYNLETKHPSAKLHNSKPRPANPL